MDKKVAKAIKELESKRDREWLRYKGRDFLAEDEALKLKKAYKVLIEYVKEHENTIHS